jgi:hypothetical protein
MPTETVSAERLAMSLHHYREALAPDFGLQPSTSPDWEDLSQVERKRMVAATRLALLDLRSASSYRSSSEMPFLGLLAEARGKSAVAD